MIVLFVCHLENYTDCHVTSRICATFITKYIMLLIWGIYCGQHVTKDTVCFVSHNSMLYPDMYIYEKIAFVTWCNDVLKSAQIIEIFKTKFITPGSKLFKSTAAYFPFISQFLSQFGYVTLCFQSRPTLNCILKEIVNIKLSTIVKHHNNPLL